MYRKIELEQGSQEWLDFRKDKIGSSDCPAIYNCGYETPYEFWVRRTQEKEKDVHPGMIRGSEMEPIIRKKVEEYYGYSFEPAVLQSIEFPWMIASLDGLNEEHRFFLEIKTTTKENFELAKQKKIPPIFQPQLIHQAYVTGYSGILAVYSQEKMQISVVTVDLKEKENHLSLCKEMYDHLMNFTPPPKQENDYYLGSEFEKWEKLENKYITAKYEYDLAKFEYEEAKKDLEKASEGKNVEGKKVKLTHYTRKGSIDYGSIPELQNLDLEPYRNSSIKCSKITLIDKNNEI